MTAGCVEVIVLTDAKETETCGATETAGNATVTASETPSGVMETAERGNEEEIANEETGRVAATWPAAGWLGEEFGFQRAWCFGR